jgi:hypothetical protein
LTEAELTSSVDADAPSPTSGGDGAAASADPTSPPDASKASPTTGGGDASASANLTSSTEEGTASPAGDDPVLAPSMAAPGNASGIVSGSVTLEPGGSGSLHRQLT